MYRMRQQEEEKAVMQGDGLNAAATVAKERHSWRLLVS